MADTTVEAGARTTTNDSKRLDGPLMSRLLGISGGRSLDRITRLAGQFFNVQFAWISSWDCNHQKLVSKHGLADTNIFWDAPFYKHLILSPDGIVVPDASADVRFANTPAVTSHPGIRFYAGIPLEAACGSVIGSLCVGDPLPRQGLSKQERDALRDFADLVMRELERRQLDETGADSAEKLAPIKSDEGDSFNRMEEALSNKELHRVMSSIPIYIWSAEISEGGKFAYKYISPALETITGRPAEFFLSGPDRWMSIVHPEDKPHMEGVLEHLLAKQSYCEEEEYRIIRPDGTDCYVKAWAVASQDGQRKILNGAVVNITSRKLAERELLKEEQRLQQIVRVTHDAIWEWDLHTDVVHYGEGMHALFGYTSGDRNLEWYKDRLHPEDKERVIAGVEAAITSGEQFWEDEYRLRRSDGNYAYVIDRGHVIRDDAGEAIGLVGAVMDITERKRAESEIGRLAAIVQSSVDPIISTSLDGVILTWNPAAEKLYGYSSTEAVGRPISILETPRHRGESGRVCQRVGQGEVTSYQETERLKKDGTEVSVAITASPITDPLGHVIGLSGIQRDITERKARERELDDSHGKLRDLAKRMETVREEERTRTAREIHDDLGQVLTVLGLEINALLKEAGPGAHERLLFVEKLIVSAIDAVHRICAQLRPSILDDLGLLAAIEWHAETLQARTGIKCQFDGFSEHLRLGRDECTAVFRIVQELLTNIAKHSGATEVRFSLQVSPQELRFVTTDNGRGITRREIAGPQSFGILGMRERVRTLGGQIEFHGTKGKGTTVTLSLPVANSEM